MATPTYDAFVSYSSQDDHWVYGVLIPALEAAGLKIAHQKMFGPGGYSEKNIREKIDDSRHVILVLSPGWVAGKFTMFEYLYGVSADRDSNDKRILPLLYRDAGVMPAGVGALSYDDCRDPETAVGAIERTITAIRRTAEQGPKRCHEPSCEALRRYQEQFEAAQKHIALLFAYKTVHDQLHALQLNCCVAIARELATPPDESATPAQAACHALQLSPDTWENIESLVPNLTDVIGALRTVEREQADLRPQLQWIGLLDRAHAELLKGVRDLAARGVQKALALMENALANLPVFNRGLVENARAIDLPDLVRTIEEALATAKEARMPPARLQEIEKAYRQISEVAETLAKLVAHHDLWQAADIELRRIDGMLRKDVDELVENWEALRRQMAELDQPGEQRVEAMHATARGITEAVATHDEPKLRKLFLTYRAHAIQRFSRVDNHLKDRCALLRAAGEPLAAVARATG